VILAPVPAALSRSTVAAECGRTAGVALASAPAIQLAKGVLGSMIIQKLVLIAALSIPAALFSGKMLIARGSSAPRDEAQRPAEPGAEPQPARIPPRLDRRIAANDPAGRALSQALTAATATADPYYFTFALIRLAKVRYAAGDRDG